MLLASSIASTWVICAATKARMEAKGNFMIGNGRDSLEPGEDERLTIVRPRKTENQNKKKLLK